MKPPPLPHIALYREVVLQRLKVILGSEHMGFRKVRIVLDSLYISHIQYGIDQ